MVFLIPILLYLLATLDAGFIGFRAAAGRNALIDKGDYYRKAVLRGVLFGQFAIALIALAGALMLRANAQGENLRYEFLAAGGRMLQIYLPYSGIVLIALALRLIPSVDLRSMTSVLVFGLFVFIRPIVAVAGVVWGLWPNPRWELVVIGGLILALMLSLENILSRSYETRKT